MPDQNEPVGSLTEELAKLMGVVSGLAERTSSGDEPQANTEGDSESDGQRLDGRGDSDGFGRSNPASEHADQHAHGRHIADDSAACQLCPVCQTIAFVRSASPEVREQLSASAASFAAAARGLVESFAAQHSGDGTSARESRVENIDLSEDGPWD